MNYNRKKFLGKIGLVVAGLGLSSLKEKSQDKELKGIFIHHVFFWLKNPDDKGDVKKLVQGLTKLSKVKTIMNFHIGKPAGTNRDVIEKGYTVSWLLHFANAADQDSYQSDPIHLEFIKQCSGLWSKVIVYDSIDM